MTAEEIIQTLEDRQWMVSPLVEWKNGRQQVRSWTVSQRGLAPGKWQNIRVWNSSGATIAEAMEKALKEHGHERI